MWVERHTTFILFAYDGVLLRAPSYDGGESWEYYPHDSWWCGMPGIPVTEITAYRLVRDERELEIAKTAST